MRWLAGLCLFAVIIPVTSGAQLTPEQKRLNLESFEKVWTTIRDKHWEKNPGGLDWNAIHQEYRPKVEKAETMEQARQAMREMLGRLKETHFAIFAGSLYGDIDPDAIGEGSPGIETRVVDGQAVVTRLDPRSPAEQAGVKPGWEVASVNGKPVAPVIQKLKSEVAMHDLTVERAIEARLSGAVGAKIHVVFLDGADRGVPLDLRLAEPRGRMSQFGNLPPMPVWVDSKKIGNTGYIRFNVFLDLVRVMGKFSDTVQGCMQCDGLVIDLRGNPGGIGGMAMGMAGWFVDKSGEKLGTMYMRNATLNFVINPRPEVFKKPVAILMDGSSASTSEIFAGGLKDLGRARIFGTRSAAAALPSVIEKLPNGDGFQYAVANYISEGGKPLEGIGVTPDVEVKLTREALLTGHDPALEAALEWIHRQRAK